MGIKLGLSSVNTELSPIPVRFYYKPLYKYS
jgi:hypothetical protein